MQLVVHEEVPAHRTHTPGMWHHFLCLGFLSSSVGVGHGANSLAAMRIREGSACCGKVPAVFIPLRLRARDLFPGSFLCPECFSHSRVSFGLRSGFSLAVTSSAFSGSVVCSLVYPVLLASPNRMEAS